MEHRRVRIWLGMALAIPWTCAAPAAAQLGWGRGPGSEEEGFFLFVEAVLATPRGTDQVVATTEEEANGTRTLRPVAVDWGGEPAGRLPLGYRWPGGTRVAVRCWRFDNDTGVRGDGPAGGLTHFQVGTPIYAYGYYYGTLGAPGHFDFVGRIEAESLDLDWGRSEEFGEQLRLEWSLGLRFAGLDETLEGFYDFDASTSAYFGEFAYFASRTSESRMAGLGATLEGDYRFTERFHLRGRASLSVLDGSVEGRSSLVAAGSGTRISPRLSFPARTTTPPPPSPISRCARCGMFPENATGSGSVTNAASGTASRRIWPAILQARRSSCAPASASSSRASTWGSASASELPASRGRQVRRPGRVGSPPAP